VPDAGATQEIKDPPFTTSGVAATAPTPDCLVTTTALGLPSPSSLTNYKAVSVSGNASQTLQPGIYTSIQVSGNARVTLSNSGSGIYIIKGGGMSVSGNASLSGKGVLIFNAGSAYDGTTDGGTEGRIRLGGNGTITLSGPASGPYAGVVLFQPASNTNTLSLDGNETTAITGTIYAPAAGVSISGNARLSGTLVADSLTVSGNASAFQVADRTRSTSAALAGKGTTNTVRIVSAGYDTGDAIHPTEWNDLIAAMAYRNIATGAYGVNLSGAPAGTTPEGGADDGVLAFSTAANDAYFVTGWQSSTGPVRVRSGQDSTTFTDANE
jgi:hypothetical protein